MREEEFEKSWESVKYDLELEGFTVTEEDKEVIRKVVLGEMSREQLIECLKN